MHDCEPLCEVSQLVVTTSVTEIFRIQVSKSRQQIRKFCLFNLQDFRRFGQKVVLKNMVGILMKDLLSSQCSRFICLIIKWYIECSS